jgi:putative transposase
LVQKSSKLSVRRQCELLGLNRSSVYYDKKPVDPETLRREEDIMARIDYWHTLMPCIGARKLVVKLRDDGYCVGRKLVRRLMRQMGLSVVYPKPNLSRKDPNSVIMPYLLRNMSIDFPNQVWSVDITYIKMGHHHMYMTAFIDWMSRRIIGWTLSDTLETQYVIDTLQKAIKVNGTPAIINSDQGSQFTSSEYKQFLKDNHIRQSMDGKSRWADNIVIERWFRSLKTELIYINEFDNPRDLRRAIDTYVTQYNNIRPHEALGYDTPDKVYHAAFRKAKGAA